MNYLLDANTLIEAKNRYYHMKICPGFWQWLKNKNMSNDVGSIRMVQDELTRGNDELSAWAKGYGNFFLPVDDAATQKAFADIAAKIAAEALKMKVGAMEDFLSSADPWLIAKAMTSGATVVTHEAHSANVRRKFLIPNVCEALGVAYANTFDVLHVLEAEFVLAP